MTDTSRHLSFDALKDGSADSAARYDRAAAPPIDPTTAFDSGRRQGVARLPSFSEIGRALRERNQNRASSVPWRKPSKAPLVHEPVLDVSAMSIGGAAVLPLSINLRATPPERSFQAFEAPAQTRYGLSARMVPGLFRLFGGYGGIAALLAIWELAPQLGWVDRQFFPPLSTVLHEAWKTVASGELFLHIGASLGRTLAGLLGAVAVALPLGFLLGGWLPRVTRFFQPLIHMLGQVNAFSLFPLFVLFFGIGELAKFSVIFWSCLWPLLFGTLASIRDIDPLVLKTARSMACDRLTLITRVLWPAALPAILTAIRVGAMVSLFMLIAAEMIGASRGLGWMVHNGAINYQMPRIYLAAAVTALLGLGAESVLRALEKRLVRWRALPAAK